MRNEIEMLTAIDIARLLAVTPSRIYQLIGDRAIPAVRLGGRIRIPRRAWEEWLDREARRALAVVGRDEEPAS